jgi:ribose transport system substrate-binding protein
MPRARLPRPLAGLLLLAGALSLSSCHGGGNEQTSAPPGGAPPGGPAPASTSAAPTPGQKVTIAIVTNGISPFWDPMGIGMERAAAKFGCQASWSGPQNAEIPDQKRKIEEAVSRKVDGLAVSAIDAQALTPTIDQAADAGILTITFDSDAPKSKRLIYIGTNNYKAGQAAGEKAKEVFPNGGKIIAFVGNRSAENARDRENGFKDAIKGTKIEVVDVQEDNKDPSRARRNVEDAIQSRKDVNGFLGLYSYNGPAIVDAVAAANAVDRYKIITFDAEPKTMQALQARKIEFTVVQKPYEFGYKSVEFLYKAKTEGVDKAKQELKIPADGIVDTGVELVSPKSYPDFKKRMDALGVKSS